MTRTLVLLLFVYGFPLLQHHLMSAIPLLQNAWLVEALAREDYSQIRLALLCGAAPSVSNKADWCTPLIHAVEHRDRWTILWIRLRGGDVNQTMAKGRSPLQIAAGNGDLDIAKFLLFWGANVNTQDYFSGETPLMAAATCGDREAALDMCRLLLRHGASRTIQAGSEGITAADLAVARGYTALAEKLRPSPDRK